MLIRPSTRLPVQAEPTLRWRSSNRHTIGWIGNIFCPGHVAGVPTIDHLLRELTNRPLTALLRSLHGIYGIFVYDHTVQKWSVAADNSGLYRIFYNDEAVATRFLELAAAGPARSRRIDDRAIVEYLAVGGTYGSHTPVSGIKKLRGDEMLELESAPVPAVRVQRKPAEEQPGDGEDFVLQYFETVAGALAGSRVSVDLTGGFDSRVVACLLARSELQFDCGLFGTADSGDVIVARAVAQVLQRRLDLHHHDISRLDDDLHDAWRDGDGLTEMPGLHRDRQLCLRRVASDIEVIVHGGGGEFFSDRYYAHDFPFYGTKRTDVARFYRLRIAPIPLPDMHLTEPASAMLRQLNAEIVARFAKIEEDNNNKTYDKIWYHFKAPEYFGTAFSNYTNLGLNVEAPFLNNGVAAVARNLPAWSRAFQFWHRRMITSHCPKLAEIKTFPGGYTASTRRTRMVAELARYARNQAGRVARKLTERHLGKALFHNAAELTVDIPGYRDGLRRSEMFSTAVARLQQQGILAPSLDKEKIANVHVGRMMTMGTLLAYLDDA